MLEGTREQHSKYIQKWLADGSLEGSHCQTQADLGSISTLAIRHLSKQQRICPAPFPLMPECWCTFSQQYLEATTSGLGINPIIINWLESCETVHVLQRERSGHALSSTCLACQLSRGGPSLLQALLSNRHDIGMLGNVTSQASLHMTGSRQVPPFHGMSLAGCFVNTVELAFEISSSSPQKGAGDLACRTLNHWQCKPVALFSCRYQFSCRRAPICYRSSLI